jgi:hypothetical protein
MSNVKDLTGQRFGRLTVIKSVGTNKYNRMCWLCRCDCENHNEVIVTSNNLNRGHTMSCGCLHKEKLKEKRINLKGHMFGNLLVIEQSDNIGNDTAWLCKCNCENFEIIRTEYLRNKNFSIKFSLN